MLVYCYCASPKDRNKKCTIMEVEYSKDFPRDNIFRIIENTSLKEYENPEQEEIHYGADIESDIKYWKNLGCKELKYNESIERLYLSNEMLSKLLDRLDEKITYNYKMSEFEDVSYILDNIKLPVLHCEGVFHVLTFTCKEIYFIKNCIICIDENEKAVFKNQKSTIIHFEEKERNGIITLTVQCEKVASVNRPPFIIETKQNFASIIKSYIMEYNQSLAMELGKHMNLNKDLFLKKFSEYERFFMNYLKSEDGFQNLTIEKYLGILEGLKEYPLIENCMSDIEIIKSNDLSIYKYRRTLNHFEELNLFLKAKLNLKYIIYPFLYLSLNASIILEESKKWKKYDLTKDENLILIYCEDVSIDPKNAVNLFSFSCYLSKRKILKSHIIYELYVATKDAVEKEFKKISTTNFFTSLELGIIQKSITMLDIDEMSGEEFEDYLIKWFGSKGLTAIKTKVTGDQGIDILLNNTYEKIGIQCKRWKNKVGNSAIQEAFAGAKFYKCDKALVITSNYFTKEAIQLSTQIGVELWDRDVLTRKLNIQEN